MIRGTAHNPDTFFQARETVNPFYARVPEIVQQADGPFRRADRPAVSSVRLRRRAGRRTGRGPDGLGRRNGARHGRGAAREWARRSACCRCACTGRSPRTHCSRLCRAVCGAVAVLEQTKEPGAPGEPLYLDVVEHAGAGGGARPAATMPMVIGGRYGLSSKDFNPAMAKAVFDELRKPRAAERLHRRHQRRCLAHQPRRSIRHSDRTGRCGAGGVLRSRRRRHGGRQQEQREDHRRGCRAAMRRDISFTIRTSRARRRFRICASARGRSMRPI